MELFELKAEISPAAVEAVDDLFLERGVEGWSVLEDVIVKKAWIVGIFPSLAELEAEWARLQPELPAQPLSSPVIRPLGDQDWRDSYKAHFKPSRFGPLHWVPIWEKATYPLPEGDVAIWLDPGLAFGTGNHETTRLCAERLVTLAGPLTIEQRRKMRVIDAGCGSGILALSAVRLGFSQVSAFDNDPEAVHVSGENAELNGLQGAVRFFTGDLLTGLSPNAAEIVLANIQADVLIRFADALLASVAPGGHLVLSGILAHENETVRQAFGSRATNWTVDHRMMGEWSDVWMTRPAAG